MDEENDNNEISQDSDDKFKVSVPGKFHSTLIGRKEKSRQRFESNTNTTTQPYKKGDRKTHVMGSAHSSVQSAMNENENLVAQQKPRLTHFLSIPINDKSIVQKFMDFKDEVGLMNDTRITDSHFQKTYKLHLTFGVLSLSSDDEKNSGLATLEECREIINRLKTRLNNPGDIRINIVGVDCMNNNPSNCRVLYGKVNSEILQTIANEIVAHFISKGLIEKDKNQVKLHVTMMNVVFVNRKDGKRIRNFDASAIIEKFSNYNFGEQKIEELHLSRFGGGGGEVYYQSEGVLIIS